MAGTDARAMLMEIATSHAASGAPVSGRVQRAFEAASRRVAELEKNEWYTFYLAQQGLRMASDVQMITEVAAPGAKLLDLGSNPPFSIATVQTLGYDVTGVDINPGAFARSRDAFGFKSDACDIERDALPYPDEAFDVVSMCEVFEHLRINPVFTLREVHRVLRRGGVLHLSTPNLFSLAGLTNFLVHRRAQSWSHNDLFDELNFVNVAGFAGHVREYTYREVEGFLARVGFARVESRFRLGGAKMWTRPLYACAPYLRPNVVVHAYR